MSNDGERKSFLSSGLSWQAIAIIVTVLVAAGPVIGVVFNINRELGNISTSLQRVVEDLTDNKSDHQDFRKGMVDGRLKDNEQDSRITDHERRLTTLEK